MTLNQIFPFLSDYFNIVDYSISVKYALIFLLVIFAGILLLSLFTLSILAFHKINSSIEAKYHGHFTDLAINYALDPSAGMPQVSRFQSKYLRNAILDLLFVTKGFERNALMDVYKLHGFWDADIKRLKSSRWNKRLSALVRLDQWQICLGIDLLSPLLVDTNPQIRQISIKNLSRTKDKKEALYLISTLARQELVYFHSTRYEAIHRLVQHHPDSILIALKEKNKILLWPFILSAIGNVRMIEAIPSLISLIQVTDDPATREKTLVALGKIGDPRGIDILISSLDSANAAERLAALQSLFNIDSAQITEHQDALLNDSDPLIKNWMNFYLRIN
jgi:hypothetical protein